MAPYKLLILATHLSVLAALGDAPPVGGDMDLSFGIGGQAIATYAGHTSQAFGIDSQSDGKLIVAGQAWAGSSTYRMLLARFESNGTLDATFGSSGFASYGPTANLTYAARCVRVLADGRILVAGDASGNVMVVRFLASGALDTSFFVSPTSVGTNAQVTGMSVHTDGKIYVSANATRSGGTDSDGYVLRFNATGTWDSSFGRFSYGGTGEQTVAAVLALPDGKTLHVGTASGTDLYVARLTASGALDSTFRSGGRAILSAATGSTQESARALACDADGNILVLGQSNPGSANDIYLARLTAAGLLDTNFSSDGWLLTNFGGAPGLPTGIALQADGRILIAGHSLNSGQGRGLALRRFLWTGDDDTSFHLTGLALAPVGTSSSESSGLVVQPSGKIAVGGTGLEGGFLRGLAAARFEAGPDLVGPAITITQDLADQTAPLGSLVKLSVTAECDLPLIYIWYKDNSLIQSGTSPFYQINSAALSNEGTYRVTIRHGSASVASATAVLKVPSPPVVTSHNGGSQIRTPAGANFGFAFNITGRAPFTWTWYKDDVQDRTGTTNSYSLNIAISSLTPSDQGTYRLVVSNVDGQVSSAGILLEVLPNPFVEALPTGYIVPMGWSETLTAQVYSTTDNRLQWNRNGAALADGRQENYSLPAATLAQAGTYVLTLKGLTGSASSEAVKVAVLNTEPVSHVAALNKKFSMALQVAGPDLSFTWYRDGVPITANDRISGVTSPTLVFKTATEEDAGQYICNVAGYGLNMDSGIQTLAVTSTPPNPAGFSLPQAQIGLRYDYQPQLPSLATGLEFTGLPPGLTYSKTANRITGQPTKPGSFTVKVTAVNPVAKSAPLAFPMIVAALPAGMEGRFVSLLADGDQVEGSIDFTVTESGAYSGKLQLCNLNGASCTAAFKGAISIDNGPAGSNPIPTAFSSQTTAPITAIYKNIKGPASLALTLRTTYSDVGILVAYNLPDGGGEAYGSFSTPVNLCPWNAKNPLPASYLGSFNLALAPDGGGGPAGYGTAKVTVAAAGSLTLAGKLSDGTAVTLSAPLDLSYSALGISFLYGNRGRLGCQLGVLAGSTAPDYLDAGVIGALFWSKTPNLAAISSYPDGFSSSLSVEGGGKYLPPNVPVLTGPLVMNGPEGVNNLLVYVFGETTWGTLGKSHAVKFAKDASTNLFSFSSLTFSPATGTFTGSANYSYLEPRYDVFGNETWVTVHKPFTVQGLVVRPPSQISSVAFGYTLVPEPLPANPSRKTTVSYPVSISPNY